MVALVAILALTAWSEEELSLLKDLFTIAGISLGAVAAYSYTFLSADLQIQTELKDVIRPLTNTNSKRVMIVSVQIKNLGRSRVTKENCYIQAKPFMDELGDQPEYKPIRIPWTLEAIEQHSILRSVEALGPQQEVTEDIAFPIGGSRATTVAVRFRSSNPPWRKFLNTKEYAEEWTSRRILTVEDNS